MQNEPKLLCDGFIFPETPRWHCGSFYCCSIDEGSIFRIGEDGTKERILKIDDWLSGWAFESAEADASIILTSGKERKLLRWNGAELTTVADLSGLVSYALNDLVRTRNGHVFVGSVDFVFGDVGPADAPNSPLLQATPDGNVSVASSVTGFANGMAITPDGKKLIVADSLQANLHQWELSDDGALSNHGVYATIPGSVPDGISLDEEGGVWVACAHRGVVRVLEGGEITHEVKVGSTGATACMLGGEDGRTLLITASDSHDRRIIHDNPSGRLFTMQVEVPGAGLPSWY